MLVERQAAEDHGVDDGKDGGPGADAQGQDRQGDDRESPGVAQGAERGLEIVSHARLDGRRIRRIEVGNGGVATAVQRNREPVASAFSAKRYSYRSATFGSTRAARRAGQHGGERGGGEQDRRRDGDRRGIPRRQPVEKRDEQRPAASAAGMPIAIPRTTSTSVSRRMPRMTLNGVAPSATRTPISVVRCATEYAITP